MKFSNPNPFVVSKFCNEILIKSTSLDDIPAWAILELAETKLLNGDSYQVAEMISAVRERLRTLDDHDLDQPKGLEIWTLEERDRIELFYESEQERELRLYAEHFKKPLSSLTISKKLVRSPCPCDCPVEADSMEDAVVQWADDCRETEEGVGLSDVQVHIVREAYRRGKKENERC